MNDRYQWYFEPIDKEIFVNEIGHETIENYRKVGPRIRDSYILHFVYSGKGNYNGEKILSNTGFLICPNAPHYFEVKDNSNYEHFWIGFKGEKVKILFEQSGIELKNQILKFVDTASLYKKLNILFEEYPKSKSKPMLLMSMLYLFFAHVEKKVTLKRTSLSNQEEYVRGAVKYMEENYFDKISMEDVATFVKISEKYMCKLFKQIIGTTPQAHLKWIRLKKAEALLIDTHLPINEIATSVGYENTVDFSQMFRKQKGITPSQFRKNYK